MVWSLMTFTSPSYGGVPLPGWGLALGWCMTAFVLAWIPAIAGYKLMRAKGNLWKVRGFLNDYIDLWIPNTCETDYFLCFPQRLKTLCSPSEDWHPYLDVHRGERYSKERCQTRGGDRIDLSVISSSWLWWRFICGLQKHWKLNWQEQINFNENHLKRRSKRACRWLLR